MVSKKLIVTLNYGEGSNMLAVEIKLAKRNHVKKNKDYRTFESSKKMHTFNVFPQNMTRIKVTTPNLSAGKHI